MEEYFHWNLVVNLTCLFFAVVVFSLACLTESPEWRSFGYRLKIFAALEKLGVTVTHDNLDN